MKAEVELWAAVLSSLEKQISRPSFETWLKGTEAFREGNKWIITTKNEFAKDWLKERYGSMIKETIYSITNEYPELSFTNGRTVDDETYPINKVDNIWLQIKFLNFTEKKRLFELLQNDLDFETSSTDTGYVSTINPNFTFDSFKVDSGNRFAASAAEAVANAVGKAYNPLFIHGPTGTGKTHLLHAIGNDLLENGPDAKIIYLNSDQFMNDFINSIRENNRKAFRERFRQADILLLDDVDLLIGKESTQEELFHIFNILHEQSKQIVITSTRSIKEMPAMLERLKSRFEWGLVTDISKVNLLEEGQHFTATSDVNQSQNEDGLEELERIEQLELEVRELRSQLQKLSSKVDLL